MQNTNTHTNLQYFSQNSSHSSIAMGQTEPSEWKWVILYRCFSIFPRTLPVALFNHSSLRWLARNLMGLPWWGNTRLYKYVDRPSTQKAKSQQQQHFQIRVGVSHVSLPLASSNAISVDRGDGIAATACTHKSYRFPFTFFFLLSEDCFDERIAPPPSPPDRRSPFLRSPSRRWRWRGRQRQRFVSFYCYITLLIAWNYCIVDGADAGSEKFWPWSYDECNDDICSCF